jgi:hypothetical protein
VRRVRNRSARAAVVISEEIGYLFVSDIGALDRERAATRLRKSLCPIRQSVLLRAAGLRNQGEGRESLTTVAHALRSLQIQRA